MQNFKNLQSYFFFQSCDVTIFQAKIEENGTFLTKTEEGKTYILGENLDDYQDKSNKYCQQKNSLKYTKFECSKCKFTTNDEQLLANHESNCTDQTFENNVPSKQEDLCQEIEHFHNLSRESNQDHLQGELIECEYDKENLQNDKEESNLLKKINKHNKSLSEISLCDKSLKEVDNARESENIDEGLFEKVLQKINTSEINSENLMLTEIEDYNSSSLCKSANQRLNKIIEDTKNILGVERCLENFIDTTTIHDDTHKLSESLETLSNKFKLLAYSEEKEGESSQNILNLAAMQNKKMETISIDEIDFNEESKPNFEDLMISNYEIETIKIQKENNKLVNEVASLEVPDKLNTNLSTNKTDEMLNTSNTDENNFNNSLCNLFKCYFCDYKSEDRYKLVRHVVKIHKTKKPLNQTLTSEMSKAYGISTNKRKETDILQNNQMPGPSLLKCSYCDYKSEDAFYVMRHSRSVHGQVRSSHYKKPTSDAGTESKETISTSSQGNNEAGLFVQKPVKVKNISFSKIYSCSICNFKTKYSQNVVRHAKLKHGYVASLSENNKLVGPKATQNDAVNFKNLFSCAVCNFSSREHYSLVNHFLKRHQNQGMTVVNHQNYNLVTKQCTSENFKPANFYPVQQNQNKSIYSKNSDNFEMSIVPPLSKRRSACEANSINSKQLDTFKSTDNVNKDKPIFNSVTLGDIPTDGNLANFSNKSDAQLNNTNSKNLFLKKKQTCKIAKNCKLNSNKEFTYEGKLYKCSFCSFKTKYLFSVGRHIKLKHYLKCKKSNYVILKKDLQSSSKLKRTQGKDSSYNKTADVIDSSNSQKENKNATIESEAKDFKVLDNSFNKNVKKSTILNGKMSKCFYCNYESRWLCNVKKHMLKKHEQIKKVGKESKIFYNNQSEKDYLGEEKNARIKNKTYSTINKGNFSIKNLKQDHSDVIQKEEPKKSNLNCKKKEDFSEFQNQESFKVDASVVSANFEVEDIKVENENLLDDLGNNESVMENFNTDKHTMENHENVPSKVDIDPFSKNNDVLTSLNEYITVASPSIKKEHSTGRFSSGIDSIANSSENLERDYLKPVNEKISIPSKDQATFKCTSCNYETQLQSKFEKHILKHFNQEHFRRSKRISAGKKRSFVKDSIYSKPRPQLIPKQLLSHDKLSHKSFLKKHLNSLSNLENANKNLMNKTTNSGKLVTELTKEHTLNDNFAAIESKKSTLDHNPNEDIEKKKKAINNSLDIMSQQPYSNKCKDLINKNTTQNWNNSTQNNCHMTNQCKTGKLHNIKKLSAGDNLLMQEKPITSKETILPLKQQSIKIEEAELSPSITGEKDDCNVEYLQPQVERKKTLKQSEKNENTATKLSKDERSRTSKPDTKDTDLQCINFKKVIKEEGNQCIDLESPAEKTYQLFTEDTGKCVCINSELSEKEPILQSSTSKYSDSKLCIEKKKNQIGENLQREVDIISQYKSTEEINSNLNFNHRGSPHKKEANDNNYAKFKDIHYIDLESSTEKQEHYFNQSQEYAIKVQVNDLKQSSQAKNILSNHLKPFNEVECINLDLSTENKECKCLNSQASREKRKIDHLELSLEKELINHTDNNFKHCEQKETNQVDSKIPPEKENICVNMSSHFKEKSHCYNSNMSSEEMKHINTNSFTQNRDSQPPKLESFLDKELKNTTLTSDDEIQCINFEMSSKQEKNKNCDSCVGKKKLYVDSQTFEENSHSKKNSSLLPEKDVSFYDTKQPLKENVINVEPSKYRDIHCMESKEFLQNKEKQGNTSIKQKIEHLDLKPSIEKKQQQCHQLDNSEEKRMQLNDVYTSSEKKTGYVNLDPIRKEEILELGCNKFTDKKESSSIDSIQSVKENEDILIIHSNIVSEKREIHCVDLDLCTNEEGNNLVALNGYDKNEILSANLLPPSSEKQNAKIKEIHCIDEGSSTVEKQTQPFNFNLFYSQEKINVNNKKTSTEKMAQASCSKPSINEDEIQCFYSSIINKNIYQCLACNFQTRRRINLKQHFSGKIHKQRCMLNNVDEFSNNRQSSCQTPIFSPLSYTAKDWDKKCCIKYEKNNDGDSFTEEISQINSSSEKKEKSLVRPLNIFQRNEETSFAQRSARPMVFIPSKMNLRSRSLDNSDKVFMPDEVLGSCSQEMTEGESSFMPFKSTFSPMSTRSRSIEDPKLTMKREKETGLTLVPEKKVTRSRSLGKSMCDTTSDINVDKRKRESLKVQQKANSNTSLKKSANNKTPTVNPKEEVKSDKKKGELFTFYEAENTLTSEEALRALVVSVDDRGRNYHNCPKCNFATYFGIYSINRHLLSHIKIVTKCNLCSDNILETEHTSLVRHMRTKHGMKTFTCSICKSQFSDERFLKLHQLRFAATGYCSGEKGVETSISHFENLGSSDSVSLENGLNTNHSEETYQEKREIESVCNSAFTTKRKRCSLPCCEDSKNYNRQKTCPNYSLKTTKVNSSILEAHTESKKVDFSIDKTNNTLIQEKMDYIKLSSTSKKDMSTQTTTSYVNSNCEEGLSDNIDGPMRKTITISQDKKRTFECSHCPFKASWGSSLRRHLIVEHGYKRKSLKLRSMLPLWSSKGRKTTTIRCSKSQIKGPQKPLSEITLHCDNDVDIKVAVNNNFSLSLQKELLQCLKNFSKARGLISQPSRTLDSLHCDKFAPNHENQYTINQNQPKKRKTFHCSQCSYQSNQKKNVKRHCRVRHKHPFIKSQPPKTGNSSNELISHQEGQNDTVTKKVVDHILRCTFCDYTSKWKGNLQRHIKSQHNSSFSNVSKSHDKLLLMAATKGVNNSMIKSKLTNKSEKQVNPIKLKETTTNFKKRGKGTLNQKKFLYTCLKCNLKTTCKSVINKHILELNHGTFRKQIYLTNPGNKSLKASRRQVATDDSFKKVAITSAKRKITSKNNFIPAKETQEDPTQEKAFSCPHCSFKTSYRYNLSVHKMIHNKKIFKCRNCAFKTFIPKQIKSHIQTHKMSKVFQCAECHYRTITKSMLNRHSKIHIREEF